MILTRLPLAALLLAVGCVDAGHDAPSAIAATGGASPRWSSAITRASGYSRRITASTTPLTTHGASRRSHVRHAGLRAGAGTTVTAASGDARARCRPR